MNQSDTPQQVSDQVGRIYFGVINDGSRKRAIRQCLLGAVEATVLVPLLFYIRFRAVGPLGWGTTVFFVVYLMLTAIGLNFRPRTEFHSPVALRGDWLDRVGAFWLVGCAFGPFLGWVLTSGTLPITQNSWRWLYGARLFFAAVVPILLALPLTRYIRGKSALIALRVLVVVTLIPVSTAMNVSLDLWEGPVGNGSTEPSNSYLAHTARVLDH